MIADLVDDWLICSTIPRRLTGVDYVDDWLIDLRETAVLKGRS